jgi:hypothetical protein
MNAIKLSRKRFFLLVAVFTAFFSIAQENDTKFPQLRGALVMAYSYIPQAYEGGKTVAIIPAWGLDLDYHFSRKWAIFIQNDVKLQSFEIEDEDEVVLERNFPFSIAVLGHYTPFSRLSFFAGPGIELEKNRNLWIFKIGVGYSFEISETFELGIGLIYENREELYDGLNFGVSFSYQLWEKK